MTQTKQCGRCKQSRPLVEYNRRTASRDGLQSLCRDCNRANARADYSLHRESQVRRIIAGKESRRSRALEWIGRHLLTHPCVDCGETDIRVLDFDHRSGVEKQDGVMRLAQGGHAISTIAAEIAKCDVRCRNCHAIVTYERLGRNWRSTVRLQSMAEVDAFLSAEDGS
ncbi:hypothetical protein [Agromyces indicus]|uniref:HNH endonuclease n=1 Tax=Agromyces indicus TaxID=758919 RepID=A0ABU1FKZ5_9MICO|nr:hypothetical protein [Agromyces indicus]MDR5692428.1 hypothetical protein [Agromyces indicus]